MLDRWQTSSIVIQLNVNKKKLLLLSVLAAIVIVALAVGLTVGLRSRDSSDNQHARLTGAAVTSNGIECAGIGADILRRNGSAVDAAIATLFCEGVTCPQSMGLGGGFLATIYIRDTNTAVALDAREVAPAAATKDMYVNQSSVQGGLAVAVPGEVKGYWELHQRYGRLEWKELVEPTVRLCREGHLVTGYLERILKGREQRIRNIPTLRDVFINPATDQTWQEGDRLKRPTLADTLEVIAREGADALYSRNGTLLPMLMRDLKLFGSIITEDDFYNYEPRWVAPARTSIRKSSHVYSFPLPGSGPVLNYMLNILDNYDELRPDDPLSWHRIVESFKHGYGMRTRLGDPAFVPGIEDNLDKLASKTYARYISETIQNDRTHAEYAHYGAEFSNERDQGTAHVSVLAPNGDAVAVTSTINSVLGAMIRSPSTGIVLNDEMDDFSTPGLINSYGLPASPANFIVPGKRPLSSMTPTIVTDGTGDVRIVAGSAGGSRITTATMQLIVRHLLFGETLGTIIRAPRMHHQLAPMSIEYEKGFDPVVIAGLEARGHVCVQAASDGGFAALTAIVRHARGTPMSTLIEATLGAMIRSPSTGIVLNDEMDDFSTPGLINSYGLPASPANFIVPGKRPLSSMTPTIVTDDTGDVRIVAGSAGGSRITTATMQLIVRHLLFGETLDTIIRAPRMHHQLAPMSIEYEKGFDPVVIAGLEARGHVCVQAASDGGFAALTAIVRHARGTPMSTLIEATYDPRRSGTIILTILIVVFVLATQGNITLPPPAGEGGPIAHHHRTGAVVANGAECAAIGAQILRQNGTAADAAIATLFCEGVTCPQSMGLGGGFLLTIYDRQNGTVETLNARESAPAAAERSMLRVAKERGQDTRGLTVAVPGELKGYWELHQRYGRLEWAALVQPTIELCERGHLVTPYLSRILARVERQLYAEPSMREVFINPATNRTWQEGDTIKRLQLAKTLRIVAAEGVDSLYSANGTLLRMVLKDLKSFGSIIEQEDFLSYRPRWEAPDTVTLAAGEHVHSIVVPGSGTVQNFMLRVLDGYANMSATDPLSWHRIVESMKFAYGLRTRIGDPAFTPEAVAVIRNLTDPQFAAYVREQLISDERTHDDFAYYGAEFADVEDKGTAHICVLAPNGDAVSATSTINYLLGAKIRSQSTGIILNDEMDDFSTPGTVNTYGLPASPANFIAPRKIPLSSMTPSIVTDRNGAVRMVLGGAGGSRITSATAVMIYRHLVFGDDLATIMSEKRLHHQLAPMWVDYEAGFLQTVLDGLVAKGHRVKEKTPDAGFAAATGIVQDAAEHLVQASYDPRRGGSVEIVKV
uniref:Gamma-glutamyltransferase n=1 Tax=Anopheles quadriannulatus TaxID=34691 RepID=A0A182XNQ6_ANOQN